MSVSADVPYNQHLGNKWFVEPSAGIIWSRTHIDALNVPGTGVLGTPLGPGFVPNGCPSQSDSKVNAGWTVGLGFEFGLTQNVSAKSEIMYFDLGSDRYNMAGIPADVQSNGFISTVGLHVLFGG